MGSIKATAMVITLLTFCLLATNTSAAYYPCCRSYMRTRIQFKSVKGYSMQTVTEMCPINAIIFHTSRGKACTNPALKWVMDYVKQLSNKVQKVHIKTSQEQKQNRLAF